MKRKNGMAMNMWLIRNWAVMKIMLMMSMAAFSIWCNCSTVASFHKHTKRRGKKGERNEILLKWGEGMEEWRRIFIFAFLWGRLWHWLYGQKFIFNFFFSLRVSWIVKRLVCTWICLFFCFLLRNSLCLFVSENFGSFLHYFFSSFFA